MVINRKIIRSFNENKSRYIGLLLLIIISCMIFTSFRMSAPNALDKVERFFKETNVEDVNFSMLKPIDNIDELEIAFNIELEQIKQFDYSYLNNSTLRIFQDTVKINKYSVIDGRGLENENEIVLDKKFAEAYNIDINSTIEINNTNFIVVGYVTKPDYIYTLKSHTDLMNNPNGFGFGIISPGDFDEFNSYLSIYSAVFHYKNQALVREYLNSDNFILHWLDRSNNTRISAVIPDLEAKIPIGTVLPVFIFITTCLIISIVLWRLLKTEFSQIGTLYAIGYKKLDILKHYLIYPTILCFLGGIIGTFIGMLLSRHIVYATDGFQYNLPIIDMDYNYTIILTSFVLPFIFLIPTTILIVLKALRYSPLELMRGAGNKIKIGILEKGLNLNKFKFDTKFRIREMVRYVPRHIVMTLGISFASLLLLLGFIMNDSFLSLVEDGYDDLYKNNYQYVMKGLKSEYYDNAERKSLVSVLSYDNNKNEVEFSVYGIESNSSFISLKDSSGNKLDYSQAIVNIALAKKLNIKEGDTVTVISKINDNKTDFVVNKIADSYVGHSMFLPLDKFNDAFGFPKDSYSILLSEKPLILDPEVVANVITTNEIKDAYNNILSALRVMILIIGILASIIGLIVIYILTSLIIEENKFNISLMKVLGYSKNKIFSLLVNINVIFVTLGFIISIPITLSLMDLLFEEIAEDMNLTIPAVISLESILLALFIMLITYYISNMIIRKKVIQIPMTDSLKSREE